MARLRSKFDGLNEEKNTKLQVLRTFLVFFLGFIAVAVILGVVVYVATHD
mgnify:CR=1 FL=1